MRKTFDFILFSIAFVLLSIFIRPRKNQRKRIIGFAAAQFTVNVKYLYLEMAKYPNAKVFFVTDRKEMERLSGKAIDVHYHMDVKSVPLFLRTQAWVTSHGPYFIPFVSVVRGFIPFFRWKHGSKWVSVWHAVEVKDVGREKMLRDYDLGFVTSEFYKQYYSKKARIWDKLKITGNARIDPLVKRSWNRKELLQEMGIPFNRKNVLYAPTWGHGKRKAFLPWENTIKNIEDLEEFSQKNNCSFLIRMHPEWYRKNPEEKKKLEEAIKRSKHIFDLSPQKYIDVQRALYIADILITDWSSIANDFILLDRPIIFLDTKLPVQELILKPEERAGYIIRNKEEIFERLQESLDNPDLFETKKKTLIKKLYKHLDGNSAKRCTEEILKLLKNSSYPLKEN